MFFQLAVTTALGLERYLQSEIVSRAQRIAFYARFWNCAVRKRDKIQRENIK